MNQVQNVQSMQQQMMQGQPQAPQVQMPGHPTTNIPRTAPGPQMPAAMPPPEGGVGIVPSQPSGTTSDDQISADTAMQGMQAGQQQMMQQQRMQQPPPQQQMIQQQQMRQRQQAQAYVGQLPQLWESLIQAAVKVQQLENELSWELIERNLRKLDLADYLLEIDTDWEGLEDDPILAQQRIQFFSQFLQIMQQFIPMIAQIPDAADTIATMITMQLEGFKTSRQMRGQMEDYLFKFVETIKKRSQLPQQPQPTPDMIKAQANMIEAQARMMEAQVKAQGVQTDSQLKMQELQVNMNMVQLKEQMAGEYARTMAEAKIQADTNQMQLKMAQEDRHYQHKAEVESLKAKLDYQKELEKMRIEIVSKKLDIQKDLFVAKMQSETAEKTAKMQGVLQDKEQNKQKEPAEKK